MNRPGHAICLGWAMLSIHAGAVFCASWVDVSNGLPPATAGVRGMVIDGTRGSTLYAQTLDGGISKSIDAGANWKALGNIAGVQVIGFRCEV